MHFRTLKFPTLQALCSAVSPSWRDQSVGLLTDVQTDLISSEDISLILQEEFDDSDVARLGGNVNGSPAISHGEVGVCSRLEQHPSRVRGEPETEV